MASILKVDELQGITAAGDITVTSEGGAATQSLQQGLAKSWVRMDGDPSLVVNNSFNTSSTSDLNTGSYAQLFVNNFDAGENYSSHSSADDESFGNKTTIYYQTSSEARMQIFQGSANTGIDTDRAMMTHHGDLA